MEALTMSAKDRRKLVAMERVRSGEWRVAHAARVLGLSYRHAKRVWKRFCRDGARGLVHGLRGRPSARAVPAEVRARALEACRERYAGFGPVLASEHLQSDEGLAVGRETLRRWLARAGLREPSRSAPKHRKCRDRRRCRGELVQMDGSDHAWFGPARPRCVLMVMVDDATSATYARMYPSEDTVAAFDMFGRYVRQYGLPVALYPDRDSIYVCTREARLDEQLRGEGPLTQFGRAMRALHVRIVPAGSPQAKGRVERRHRVFQDRLVKELALRGSADMDAANEFLEREFLPMLAARFTLAPADPADAHRPCPPPAELDAALCFEEPRTVANDWTLRWRTRRFQIHASHERLRLPGRRVLVRERLDGTVRIVHGGQELRFQELSFPAPPPQDPPRKAPRSRAAAPRKPAEDHPWRQRAACPVPPSILRRAMGAHSRIAGGRGTSSDEHAETPEGDISNGRLHGDISNGR